MIRSSFVGCIGILVVASAAGAADPPSHGLAIEYVQPLDQFVAAVDNISSAPSFVLITIIDARKNEVRTACVTAPLLLAAIDIERGVKIGTDLRETRRIALANSAHEFSFSKPEALANLGLSGFFRGKSEVACQIIRAGKPAFLADRTGQVREGQP